MTYMFILKCALKLVLKNILGDLLSLEFSISVVNAVIIYAMRAVLSRLSVTEKYKSSSTSLRNFLQPSVT